MKKRFFAIAMMVLITLSLFVPITASAEELDYFEHDGMQFPRKIISSVDGTESLVDLFHLSDAYMIIQKVGTIYSLYIFDEFEPIIQNGDLRYQHSGYINASLQDGYWKIGNYDFVDTEGSFRVYSTDWSNRDLYDVEGNLYVQGNFIPNSIFPDNGSNSNPVPLYEFYPDRIDRSISGVEDIIFAYYEDDTTPRPSKDSYIVMFKNNDTVYFASASQPFRKYSGSNSIMLADQSNFDYWYIDGAKINYLGKTASFTPSTWIAGTHDVLNWNDNTVFQSFENIGNVAFPKTPPTQTQTLPSVVGAKMLAGVTTEMIALLPCLIALLTALLGLRKALAILRMILETA